MTITQWVEECNEIAAEHGWHDRRREIPELLCLVHSEVSEALESYRNSEPFFYVENGKPEGLSVELADVLIRIFDMCGSFGIDLEMVLRAKVEYNKSRPYRHGGKVV